MSHESGGTIDGVHYSSRTALAKALKTSRGYLSHRANVMGARFVLHKHVVVLDGFEEYETPGANPRRAPVDFTARALAARKLYDSNGCAREGLLIKRSACPA